jgi:hypothetical protein
MSEERLTAALRRIEQALVRVEDAASRPFSAPSADQDGAFAALQERHSALKAETRSVLAELDGLISHAKAGGSA